MLAALAGFIAELRAVGVPVSTVEASDAAVALRHVDLSQRAAVRSALATTLVKSQRHAAAFDVAFDVYFGPAQGASPGSAATAGVERAEPADGGAAAELGDALAAALSSGDIDALRLLVQRAVDLFGGFDPGRPAGGRYYTYRVLRRLDEDQLAQQLQSAVSAEQTEQMLEQLRDEIRREIIRRLVAVRGRQAVAKTLRRPLVEDIDLMYATPQDLARIEKAINPLARRLATRLARRTLDQRHGRLDVRATIRRSLGHGGALLHPRFKRVRRSKPDIVLLCDVSGSMATFARFTMQLVYAVSGQFARVRSFAFIDGLDEVTGFFGPGVAFAPAMQRMRREADVVWQDGHSDYGHSLRTLVEDSPDAIDQRTTLVVTGDARNNYRATEADLFADLTGQARAAYWLNPEAKRYWDTGDSVMSRYTPACDGVYEVRTLRQLERFVATVALPSRSRRAGVLAVTG